MPRPTARRPAVVLTRPTPRRREVSSDRGRRPPRPSADPCRALPSLAGVIIVGLYGDHRRRCQLGPTRTGPQARPRPRGRHPDRCSSPRSCRAAGRSPADSSTRPSTSSAQRVDGSGVAEAEVTTQGGRNIVVSVPGKPDQRKRRLDRASPPSCASAPCWPRRRDSRAGPGAERHPDRHAAEGRPRDTTPATATAKPSHGQPTPPGPPSAGAAARGHDHRRQATPSRRPRPPPSAPATSARPGPSPTAPSPTADDATDASDPADHARRSRSSSRRSTATTPSGRRPSSTTRTSRW